MTDTLLGILTTQAEKNADTTALIFEGEHISYADLQARACQVATGMDAWGIKTQSRIALLDVNSVRYFEILFGTLMLNCAELGINTRLAAPELEYILNDSQAPVLFVAEPFYGLIETIEQQLEHIQYIVALDGGHDRWIDYSVWRNQQATQFTARPGGADDHVMQMYTSGTTGHPKGVCHSNYTWMKFAEASASSGWAYFDENDVLLVAVPLFHVAGINPVLVAFQSGATSVIQKNFIPQQVLENIENYAVTFTLLVPAMIQATLGVATLGSYDFSSLKKMAYGGSPINAALLKKAQKSFNCDFIHLYGMTENCGGGTCLPPEDHLPGSSKLRSAGKLYPNSELKIVDEQGNPVPDNTVGEILFKHEWLMQEYWNKPDATSEAIRDGWLHTGDAGYLDEDGYLYIHDRIKDMIVSGGENVYPAEVENALFGHPDIADVAVIGVPDEQWGESVKAIVVLKPGSTFDEAGILEHAREQVAGYKVPKSIECIDELPRNASGKILKRELRKPYWDSLARKVN